MFYFGQNFGFFIGSLQENITHKHYALQVSVSFHSSLRLQVKGKDEILGQAFLINSKVEHQLQCEGLQITLLINPLSSADFKGRFCAGGRRSHLQHRR